MAKAAVKKSVRKKALQETYKVIGREVVLLEDIKLAETHKVRDFNLETVERYADRMLGFREDQKKWSKTKANKEAKPKWSFPLPKVLKFEWADEDNNWYLYYECVTGNHTVISSTALLWFWTSVL